MILVSTEKSLHVQIKKTLKVYFRNLQGRHGDLFRCALDQHFLKLVSKRKKQRNQKFIVFAQSEPPCLVKTKILNCSD